MIVTKSVPLDFHINIICIYLFSVFNLISPAVRMMPPRAAVQSTAVWGFGSSLCTHMNFFLPHFCLVLSTFAVIKIIKSQHSHNPQYNSLTVALNSKTTTVAPN